MNDAGRRMAGWLAAGAMVVAMAGCGGSSAVKGCMDPTAVNFDPAATADDGSCLAFQGPRNPDFESSDNWVQNSNNGYAGNGFVTFPAGTSFMPTHGLQFLQFWTGTSNNWYSGSAAIYQDGVSFQRSTSLTFDYTASGAVYPVYGSVTVEILFTSSGTVTLWSKVFTTAFGEQKLGETVALPALPERGRLTIKVSAVGGQNTDGNIQLDHIRVN
jgi:hypothetical protein